MEEKNDNLLIRKSNALVEAKYKLTLLEQRLVLYFASRIRRTDKDFDVIKMDYVDLMQALGIDKKSELIEVVIKIHTKRLRIKRGEGRRDLYVGWVSSVEFDYTDEYIEFCFDPKLKPYLLNLNEQFTLYNPKNILKLRSAYSIRIYELISQYKTPGIREIPLSNLKDMLGIPKDEYILYGHFKTKILEVAERELKESGADLWFTFSPTKKGKKVIGIKFKIHRTSDNKIKAATFNPILLDKLIAVGCSDKLAKKLIKQHPDEYILGKIDLVEESNLNVKSKIALLQSALKHDYKDMSKETTKKEELERKTREAEEQKLKEAEQNKLKEEQKESKQIEDYYNSLSPTKKLEYRDKAIVNATKKGISLSFGGEITLKNEIILIIKAEITEGFINHLSSNLSEPIQGNLF